MEGSEKMKKLNALLSHNTWQMKLLRTLLQAVIGFLIDNLSMIVASTQFSPEVQTLIVTLTMAILSPIMATLGGKTTTELTIRDLNIEAEDELSDQRGDDDE